MRTRKEVIEDFKNSTSMQSPLFEISGQNYILLEVLLDVRQLLARTLWSQAVVYEEVAFDNGESK